jgi:hypothetical protein
MHIRTVCTRVKVSGGMNFQAALTCHAKLSY